MDLQRDAMDLFPTMEVRTNKILIDSSDTVANEYSISIRSILVP